MCCIGWKQTVQSLIERFTELNTPAESPLSGMGELEDGESPEDAELGKARAQRSMVLQQASQRITQANMSLHKLRTHFHKVGCIQPPALPWPVPLKSTWWFLRTD